MRSLTVWGGVGWRTEFGWTGRDLRDLKVLRI